MQLRSLLFLITIFLTQNAFSLIEKHVDACVIKYHNTESLISACYYTQTGKYAASKTDKISANQVPLYDFGSNSSVNIFKALGYLYNKQEEAKK